MKRLISVSLVLASTLACGFDDPDIVRNMEGTVVIPREAATRMMFDASGAEVEVTDSRLIGPVYLGLYPSIREGLLEYPHPEVGPIFKSGVPGDTYPYGGTTVGDFRFACLEFLTCRVSSGRFVDFDDLLLWFNQNLQLDVPDLRGDPVQTGEYIKQTCFQMLNFTTTEEIRVTARDENDDGLVDDKDLDFHENSDGDFEAKFVIWQQEYFESPDGDAFSLWGWMDSPSVDGFRFSTCNESIGQQETEYDQNFFGGMQHQDLLNQPSNYIGPGDWTVSSGGWHEYSSPDEEPRLRLDFKVD